MMHVLSDADVVSTQHVPPGWTVASLLRCVATAEPRMHALIDTGALISGFTNQGVAEYLLEETYLAQRYQRNVKTFPPSDNITPSFCTFPDPQQPPAIMREMKQLELAATAQPFSGDRLRDVTLSMSSQPASPSAELADGAGELTSDEQAPPR